MAINAPEVSLKMLLTTMMFDQIMLKPEEKSQIQSLLQDNKKLDSFTKLIGELDDMDEIKKEESEEQRVLFQKFFRCYSWVWKVVNWKQINHLLNIPSKNYELKLRNWECLLEWLFEDENMRTLGDSCINVLLELCFDIFMNHEIVLIGEAKFKPLAINKWKIYILKNRASNPDIESKHPWYPQERKEITSQVSPTAQNDPNGELTGEENETKNRKDSEASLKSTEGTEGSKETSQEHFLSHEYALSSE